VASWIAKQARLPTLNGSAAAIAIVPAPRGAAGGAPLGARRLRVLVFTTVFPNPAQPVHGLFVAERVKHLARVADVRVLAPVTWYPWIRRHVPRRERVGDLVIDHPTFRYVPRLLKSLDGLCLFLSSVAVARRIRREFDFDLIDAHFAYPEGFAAMLLGRLFRLPVCVTLRGTIIPLSTDPLRRALCNWTIRRATRVIAVAKNLAERARQGGVPEARISVVANGVDCERFRPQARDVARSGLGLPVEGNLLVSVGHLSRRKGFHRVLLALPELLGRFPDLRLAIVGGPGGEPDNGPELKALARELGLMARVIFTGAQPPDRIALWLNAADVVVLASDFEGCPNVVLEAMACGRPVVATKVGHIDQMLPPFAGILLDDPDDQGALARALHEALQRTWDADRIRAHVEPSSWAAVAECVLAQWLCALGGRSSSSSGSLLGPVLSRGGLER
jgi:teichuronic acid biosynthesis glycosyltransferase TuaC